MRSRTRKLLLTLLTVCVMGLMLQWIWRSETPSVALSDLTSVVVYNAFVQSTDQAQTVVLTNASHYEVDRSTLKKVFGSAEYQSGRSIIGKLGGWVCVATLKNGEQRRLILSHAGFFVIVGEKGWYRIPDAGPDLASAILNQVWIMNPPATAPAAGATGAKEFTPAQLKEIEASKK